jgi:pectate lyase
MKLKYELLENDYIQMGGVPLYRIRSLRDFGDVKKGDLGGYIESTRNLDRGDCSWVGENAKVYGNSQVYHDAKVYGNALIYNAYISRSSIFDHAIICGHRSIFYKCKIFGNATLDISSYNRVWNSLYLDHGYWNRSLEIDVELYLISSTLEKVRLYFGPD